MFIAYRQHIGRTQYNLSALQTDVSQISPIALTPLAATGNKNTPSVPCPFYTRTASADSGTRGVSCPGCKVSLRAPHRDNPPVSRGQKGTSFSADIPEVWEREPHVLLA
ncbi:hypothetical protein M231_02085 [Tremella mesenterica]|uniref:Uncharacterized protein n=1 Tax=Tremella mesenterica TaxID=5217 RepID=A0A4Q1BRT3_TREME|nr:hypothetical protein M231_02085 [Tremella mesenterica]